MNHPPTTEAEGLNKPKGDDYVYQMLMYLHRQKHLKDGCFCTTEVSGVYNQMLIEIKNRIQLETAKAVQEAELYVPISSYNGLYEVSNLGNVRSLVGGRRRGKVLKQSDRNKRGYKVISLCKDGEAKGQLVHRLVAIEFLSNPENKPCVNHIDGNPRNNVVENLEWCTYAENEQHSYAVLGKKIWNAGTAATQTVHCLNCNEPITAPTRMHRKYCDRKCQLTHNNPMKQLQKGSE